MQFDFIMYYFNMYKDIIFKSCKDFCIKLVLWWAVANTKDSKVNHGMVAWQTLKVMDI